MTAAQDEKGGLWALVGVETISFLGSEIARFGVSVWIYQATQSVYAFSALLLANTVPGLLVSPLAGSIADRYSRKLVMIGAAAIAALGTLIVLAGASFGHLSMTPIVLGAILASIGEAFQWPALSATVPLMTTEEDLPKYNGYLESGRATSMLAGPILGGAMFALLGLRGLLAIEISTFTIATVVVSLLVIPGPEQKENEDDDEEEEESLLGESLFGLKWIYQHKPLFKFLCVAMLANFFLSIDVVLMPPYCLSILDEKSYGIANGLFGGGMIVGGLLYGPLATKLKNAQLFLWTAIVMGALYVGYGFAHGLVALATINFFLAVLMTIGNAGILTIWQLKVPEELSGRVLAAVHMIASGVGPIAYLAAGPIADRLVPYLFSGTGGLAQWLTHTWGVSKSAELGALFSAIGVTLFLVFVIATTIKDVREVEELP